MGGNAKENEGAFIHTPLIRNGNIKKVSLYPVFLILFLSLFR